MATLNTSTLPEAVTELYRMWQGSLSRLDMLDRYINGQHDGPYTPPEANYEYRHLADKSVTNWMQLVLAAPAQAMYVDGYRTSGQSDNAAPWDYWQRNGLDARQAAIYRASMGYGVSYVIARDGVDPMTGQPSPVIRGVSPRRGVAAYSAAGDDWPYAGLSITHWTDREWSGDVLDDVNVWPVTSSRGDDGQWSLKVGEPVPHGATVAPMVRFPDMPDLEGRHPGMIEPLIPVQDRINQTSFDLLMTQTFASFKVRTISGMILTPQHDDTDPEATAEALAAARAAKIRVGADRMLVAEDADTKFGTLDESPLKPFVEAQDANVRHLAAVSQTPPHHLLGQMANLSAEALAAAEASLTRKVEERQTQYGEAWEQTLRVAAQIAGDTDAATDVAAEVSWRDTEARSLAATVDALGKAAQMLNVPKRALWHRIPGTTDQELARWEQLAAEDDAFGGLAELLTRQADLNDPVTGVA